MKINDLSQRQQALNPSQSFIVQAPAGSGKTELLAQRFLKLLTTVDKNPEEVLAITFTRKAASEMRHRIIAALQLATEDCPKEAHKANTWKIAQQVLQRDTIENWNLLSNPNRLRIQTIDALCAYLSKQLPILSRLGSQISISEDVELDYQQAVDATMNSLEEDVPWSDALASLLLHMDNNVFSVKAMLTSMLSHRDQWLAHVVSASSNETLRAQLESSLQRLITDTLAQLEKRFPTHFHKEALQLLNHATNEVYSTFPDSSIDGLQQWRQIASLFLTQQHEWRKSFDKRVGFPVKGATKDETQRLRNLKERIKELSAQLQDDDDLRLLLKDCLLLPPKTYSEPQWQILKALLTLLPILAAQLNLIFQQKAHVDFIEITQRALQALEHEEAPTDLALCLDYKIKHILVDEFQDTSATQFKLLELLVRGWQNNDGRSLFLVGDPMQSVYRFRAAEVGLFLQAQQFGIADIHLTPISLRANFRSSKTLVDWFNQVFNHAFPSKDDTSLGAISYSSAQATNEQEHDAIHLHHCNEDNNTEGDTVAKIIAHREQTHPGSSIALLVKSRRQLYDILPRLKEAKINFQAVEIETLAHLPFIQDLTSLTLALSHFANRLAWLSILRAPWCGLTLHDLHCIANKETNLTLWQRLNSKPVLKSLSADGQTRINAFLTVMHSILEQRGRFSLSQWVNMAWLSLGGPATLSNDNELVDCKAFFNLLSQLEQGSQLQQMELLEEKLSQLYAQGKTNASNVQVMTIHKAKGLEFDTVIIPGLETYSAQDKSKLLLWQERATNSNSVDLLLAPVKAHKEQRCATYDYIKQFEQRKNAYENIRLLYVAATRAKQELHMLASFESIESSPRSGSFLHALWPQAKHKFKTYYKTQAVINDKVSQGNLKRFAKHFQLPSLVSNSLPKLQLASTINANLPTWLEQTPKRIGIAIHSLLQHLSSIECSKWNSISTNTPLFEIMLLQQGLCKGNLQQGLKQIKQMFSNIKCSKQAQWILDPKHQDAHSEYALSYTNANNISHIVIDRTFVDNNIRWIIDYKTSQPKENETVECFLQREQQHYQSQLEHYASIFSRQEGYPIKLGLYFPIIDKWLEWSYETLESVDKVSKTV